MIEIQKFNNILSSFKIPAYCVDYSEYKNAQFYDVELKSGGRIKQLEKFSAEIALLLRASSQPTIYPLPDKGQIRVEFVAPRTDMLRLSSMWHLPTIDGTLSCLIGETLIGDPMWLDLAASPHLLVAGCTGSGKSSLLHTIIGNLLHRYQQSHLYILDPKNTEYYQYSQYPNVVVQTGYQDSLKTLQLVSEHMEERFMQMRMYGSTIKDFPPMVLVIDEFADLILQDSDHQFLHAMCRLAQKCRAAGIYLILATQRPSVDIVNGSIKANFPTRISCKVATSIDSKVILDTTGAQNLLGAGDALIKSQMYDLERFQVAYTTADEICANVQYQWSAESEEF
jgi:S-DNA-T family DNA segregation ATPase FtsK/SpoIIIE